jgi:hypothetical protein
MKSIHSHFNEFQKEVYPNATEKGVQALKRAFFAGYMAHAENASDLILEPDSQVAVEKAVALTLSAKSFIMDL